MVEWLTAVSTAGQARTLRFLALGAQGTPGLKPLVLQEDSMKSLRLAALAATLCCTVGLLAAGPAAAQTMPTPFTQKVEVTGTKGFKGTYTIERFARAGGKVVSVGTLRGTL